ncbi:hypothetical protein [Primorskyibacter sp. S87]|uniref:hypothetical protein n=1 Tax=Primorskyibacter sp. S87 TaxID=3415126 RepID=UPI003C79F1EE
MRQTTLKLALPVLLSVAWTPAAAQCFADYKAKQDNPLKLHYGVMQLSQGCSKPEALEEIKTRLLSAGWTLLNVISVFGPEGLEERKSDAGPYYLRF